MSDDKERRIIRDPGSDYRYDTATGLYEYDPIVGDPPYLNSSPEPSKAEQMARLLDGLEPR